MGDIKKGIIESKKCSIKNIRRRRLLHSEIDIGKRIYNIRLYVIYIN